MTAPTNVWIDPADCGLRVVETAERKQKEEAERQKREEAERQQREQAEKEAAEAVRRRAEHERSLVGSLQQEILPPESRSVARRTAHSPAPKVIDVAPIESSLAQMAKLLDLTEREGPLDTVFNRPDHRIEKKTQRALALAGYRAALNSIIAETRKAIEEVNALDRARFQRHLDRLKRAAEELEAEERLKYSAASAARQDAVAEANAKYEIAYYAARAKKEELSAVPPPKPVDEATRKREEARRARQAEIQTTIDEKADHAAASEEQVAQAKARCIAIYRDLNMREGEKRARIQRVLDEYSLDASILPVPIEEMLARGLEVQDE